MPSLDVGEGFLVRGAEPENTVREDLIADLGHSDPALDLSKPQEELQRDDQTLSELWFSHLESQTSVQPDLPLDELLDCHHPFLR